LDIGKVVVSTLTPEQIEAGKRLLQELDDENVKVDGALWFLFEENFWKLMLALPTVEKDGPKAAYRKIQAALEKLKDSPRIDLKDVALVKPGAPLLGLLRATIPTEPGISGIRFSNNVIDGRLIPDAYIYRLQ
jgi:hypothetical protein